MPARKQLVSSAQAAAGTEDPAAGAHVRLGLRVKQLRLNAGLTLSQLAGRAGFGKAYLSRIENGRKVPPIGTLARIAAVLGVETGSLLTDGESRQDWKGVSVVRKGDQRPMVMGGSAFGYDYLALTESPQGRALQPFLFTFPEKVDKFVFFEHDGEELMFVLSGRVEWQVGVERFILESGDAIHFDSRIPHRGHCVGGPATALVVMFSPSGSKGELA